MRHIYLSFLAFLLLSACGAPGAQDEEPCATENCEETEVNPPVPVQPVPPPVTEIPEEEVRRDMLRMPTYNPSWGLSRAIYEKAVRYYEQVALTIPNNRYVTVIDFSQHSSKKRFYLFNLAKGTVERHLTSHGKQSDPDHDGYATSFSNTVNSNKSSLGFYLTLATYTGSHGHSMRLRGLESTNSNAERRAIVMHPANYVSEASSYAGRSLGCPALDPKFSRGVIDKIKNGSLLLIDR